MTDEAQSALLDEAVQLLQIQLTQPQPCVAQASVVLGTLQERLFSHSTEPLQQAIDQHMLRFQELFVAPTAAKLTKCKTPQVCSKHTQQLQCPCQHAACGALV